jgi:hypothetical protein
MADIRPDRLTTCQSERKSIVSRRPSVRNMSRYMVVFVVNGEEILRSVDAGHFVGAQLLLAVS